MQVVLLTKTVERFEGAGGILDEPDELGSGDVEDGCGGGGIKIRRVDDIKSFGEECGEIGVPGVAGDALGFAARLPEGGWDVFRKLNFVHFSAVVDGEVESQTKKSHFLVFGLRTALTCLGANGGGFVDDADSGFDLVAMLTAGAGGAGALDGAGFEQLFGKKGGGVSVGWQRGLRHVSMVAD